MRRGRRSRLELGHIESLRVREQRQQAARSSNRRGRSELTSGVTPLRRSARLSSGPSAGSLSNLALEAEIARDRLRISSRRLRISEESSEESEERNQGIRNHLNSTNGFFHQSSIMHHISNINGNPNGGDRSYTLEPAYPLPRRVQTNTAMSPPPAVRVTVHNPLTGSELSRQDELGYYFVTVSLCREDGEGVLSQNHETQGTTASLEPINDVIQSPGSDAVRESVPLNEQMGSFAHFSNFIIIRPGNYRLKFMLVKVEQPGSVSPGDRGVDRGGSRVLATFMSPDTIVAQESPVTPQYG